MRRLAGNDPAVNEEWNCDKGRFGFMSARVGDRLTGPLVRDEETGELRAASWPEAFAVRRPGPRRRGYLGRRAARRPADGRGRLRLRRVRPRRARHQQHRLPGPRPRPTRRRTSWPRHVATRQGPTYADLEHANAVVLVGFEPEDESPIVFLRLRKAVRAHGTRVYSDRLALVQRPVQARRQAAAAVPGQEAGRRVGGRHRRRGRPRRAVA